ncbi:SPOR domain-containing protein [Novispirillum sp. DQ9]|uniref:SPOR domain-containing protein n=1 Tax=Novispirillum sp. DQ9 TaxID=3398612 RepID=UPI003C7AB8D1
MRTRAGDYRAHGRRRPMRAVALALAVSLPALAVAGCAGLYDPDGFSTAMAPGNGQPQADAALAALARGDYQRAETQATAALARDPANPYALLAAGVAYQQTGRPDPARAMYDRILALRSPAVVSGPWWGDTPRLVSDIAAENLRGLGTMPEVSGAAMPDTAASAPALGGEGVGPAARRFAVLARLRDDGLITGDEYYRRRAANLGALLPLSEQPPALGLERPAPGAEEVVSRLKALREAFETRNVSAAQHAAERTMILDGLLPADPRTRAVPAMPPSGVLEAAAMVGRLQRLREMGLITADEQARERAAIDRATRPASPVTPAKAPEPAKAPAKPATPAKPAAGATPGAPPLTAAAGTGNPAATLRTGRGPLQVLPTPAPGADDGPGDGAVLAAAQGGTVLQPAATKPAPPATPADSKPAEPKPTESKPAEPKPDAKTTGAASQSGPVAVHLASFRSRDKAEAGWTKLQAENPGLKGLTPRINEIALPGQGTFFRLLAGPVSDRAAAEALCKTLKTQYCKAVFPGN